MKAFTKEQLDILAKWEPSFFTATVSKYYRNISSKSLDTIKSVYDEVADKPYSANWSCNHCVLAFLQTVGKKYFEDLDAFKTKAAELVKALDEVMEEVPDELEPKAEKPVKKPATKKTTKKATKKK